MRTIARLPIFRAKVQAGTSASVTHIYQEMIGMPSGLVGPGGCGRPANAASAGGQSDA